MNSALTRKFSLVKPLLTPQNRTNPFPSTKLSTKEFYSVSDHWKPLPKRLQDYFDLIGFRAVLGRDILKSMTEWIEKENQESQVSMSLLITGSEGSGKSTCLLQIADWLKSEKKAGDRGIILYEGLTSKFTHGHLPYYPTQGDIYEQPELGAYLIGRMVSMNPGCADLVVTEEETLGKIADVVTKNPLEGHRAFLKVLQKLKQGTLPVYMLLDHVNCLFGPTQYRDPQGNALQIKQLPILQSLLELYTHPSKPVTAVGAVTCSDPLLTFFSVPNDKHIASIKVPELSPKESMLFLQGLQALGYIASTTEVDRRFVEHKVFMTGGNARIMYEVAMYDDLYN